MEENNLIKRVINQIKNRRQRLIDGKINSIPSPFVGFKDHFIGIEQGKYYLITSYTKGAKTQFASYTFLFNSIIYAFNNPDKIRLKIFYYPLEEKPEKIVMRFMSYLLFILSDNKIRVSPSDLDSTDNNKPISEDIISLLESDEYNNLLQFFKDTIIFSTSTNPTGVYNECTKYAKENGVIYTRKQKVKDDFGQIKEVDKFDYYVQNDAEEYKFIFVDHVSLISTEQGLNLKQSIDKLSEYCVILRNRYNFTPILIQQQAFVGENLDAFKENKLRPTIVNLSDSKYTARDCNICIGLFSPARYELKDYLGYDITMFKDNIRFMEILINRDGNMGGIEGLFFDGTVNYFKELPNPNNTTSINKIYNYLKKIRSNQLSVSFVIFSNFINKLKQKVFK